MTADSPLRPVDLARHFRWAAWNSMLEGRRLEAIGHYAHAVRHGDFASIGRSAIALLYPGISHRQRNRSLGDWAHSAQGWLDALREETLDADGPSQHGR